MGRLTAGNPALAASGGGVSAVLLTRAVVTYPETVALARALTTLGGAPTRGAAPDTAGAVAHIAGHLGLARLVVAPDDLLWARLHHRPPGAGPARTRPGHQHS